MQEKGDGVWNITTRSTEYIRKIEFFFKEIYIY